MESERQDHGLPAAPKGISRREALRYGVAALTSLALLNTVPSNPSRPSRELVTNHRHPLSPEDLLPADAGTELSRASRIPISVGDHLRSLSSGGAKVALATELACSHIEGSPTCIGLCPGRRRARVILEGFYYIDRNNNGVYNHGDTVYSPVKGGRHMELEAWGCFVIGSRLHRLEASEFVDGRLGDGRGYDLATSQPFIEILVSDSEDFEWGIDRETGERKLLPIVRFQFRRLREDRSGVLLDPTGRPYAWEGCAFLCPEDQESEEADYFIATHLTQRELDRRGMRFNPNMFIPRRNPRPAFRVTA